MAKKSNTGQFTADLDPNNPDSDGDGLSDFDEIMFYRKLDPNGEFKWHKSDHKPSVAELKDKSMQRMNPTNWDTDGDGVSDKVEFEYVYDRKNDRFLDNPKRDPLSIEEIHASKKNY